MSENSKESPKSNRRFSLKSIFETFSEVSNEMESSILFPSLLTDVPVHGIKANSSFLTRSNFTDFKGLFYALVSLKHELLFGQGNWYYSKTDNPASVKYLSHKLTQKCLALKKIISEATHVARIVRDLYDCKIENKTVKRIYYGSRAIDRIERVVKNDDLMCMIEEYNDVIKELESLILIPSLLRDIYDQDLNDYIKTISFELPQNADLMTIYNLLREIRDELVAPSNKVIGRNKHFCNITASLIDDLYTSISCLLELCLSVMNIYQEVLHRSMGTKEIIWKNDLHQFRKNDVAGELNFIRFAV